MKHQDKARRAFAAINRYVLFFLLIAFVITASIMLFFTITTEVMDITLTENDISIAAKLTFINVIFLSVIVTVINELRRKFFVERPAKAIARAAEAITKGDFNVRIPTRHELHSDEAFDEIITCFNKLAAELSGVETLRTDFIANVSHELKTPLAVIGNYATLLQAGGLDEEKRLEYARAINEATKRLSGLVSNILKLNKLENQQIFPHAERFDLSEQLCECLLGFEEAWERKGLVINTDIAEDVFVKTDKEMMTLVWNNLFSNAIKFTGEGGEISLTLRQEGDFAVVSVKDTGCGISAEVGAHMFEKFYQGDTSHKTKGNGLGLTLVKRVIDITDSEISVASRVGEGTVFTVKIKKEQNGTL